MERHKGSYDKKTAASVWMKKGKEYWQQQIEQTKKTTFQFRAFLVTYYKKNVLGITIKFANSPSGACSGSTGQKSWYSLMTFTYQRFTAVLLLIYGSTEKGCMKMLDGKDPNFFNNSWILYQKIHLLTRHCLWGEFVTTKQITVLEHPAYSPGLAPNDFFLFPKIKEILEGRHFDDIDNIRNNTMVALKAIPQNDSKIVLKGGLGAGIVHSFPRGVLWRQPRWYSAMTYVPLLPRCVRELYSLTTYI